MNQVLKWLQRWILVPLWFSSQYLSFVFFFLLYKDNILWGYINFPVCIFVSTTTYARVLQTASHIIDTHTQTNQCYTSQESPSSQAVTRRPVGRRLLKDIFLTQLLRDLEGQKSSLLKPAPVNQQVYWCWLICGLWCGPLGKHRVVSPALNLPVDSHMHWRDLQTWRTKKHYFRCFNWRPLVEWIEQIIIILSFKKVPQLAR